MQGRLRQPRALTEIPEPQHLLTPVERVHDGGDPPQDGTFRPPLVDGLLVVAAVSHRDDAFTQRLDGRFRRSDRHTSYRT